MTYTRLLLSATLLLVTGFLSVGQTVSHYDQHLAFAPDFYPNQGNEVRTAGGVPGPKYWQNRADYEISCTLNDVDHQITGTVFIHYKNNSPENLPFLWLQADQNIYITGSRGDATTPMEGGRYANPGFEGGLAISSFERVVNGKATALPYRVSDTRIQVPLATPLRSGDSITLKIVYHFDIPEQGTDRMGRMRSANGWIYAIGQWYPRMCVYDNIEGWNTLPYIGAGEFYLDYGNYDFTITAPASELIVATGELVNPADVLTTTQQQRLEVARTSDKTVIIRSEKEVRDKSSRPQKGPLTWHFRCMNTRDVAWAASKSFVWDAARINLPGGKTSLAMSVYPVESALEDGYKRSTEFTKAAIEHYSKEWFPFPYPCATNVACNISGMEYPGIVFCGAGAQGKTLWGVTSHEFGHTWFPMIVGSNERKYAWMDEGFNTFINSVADQYFNLGEFYKPDTNRALKAPRLTGVNTESIYTRPDVVNVRRLAVVAYDKPSVGLQLLREEILGKDVFDSAFRYYISNWAYKHPMPYDFFRAMENYSGENLDWFWRGWFLNDWKIDQAVTRVDYVSGDPAKGASITIRNLEQLPMPVTLDVTEQNGKTNRIKLPVEIWEQGDTWKLYYPSAGRILSVTIDPDKRLPDTDPSNNTWKAE